MKTTHNGCTFEIIRYFNDSAVIEIKPINGAFLSGETSIFKTEKIENLTTNSGGGFFEWVKDNF